jgi:O-methyltransferase domain
MQIVHQRNIYSALAGRGGAFYLERITVITTKYIMTAALDAGLASLTDLNMMVMLTGRERTLAEYCGLLKDAGLRFSKSTPIRWQTPVIEAEAA